MRRPPLIGEMIAEALGSFVLVFFGTGSVAVAVLTGAHVGLWQVASVWGSALRWPSTRWEPSAARTSIRR